MDNWKNIGMHCESNLPSLTSPPKKKKKAEISSACSDTLVLGLWELVLFEHIGFIMHCARYFAHAMGI